MASDDGKVRTFDTGATRDTAEGKYDPEGFLSPLVIDRFCEYMHKNRTLSDGSLRDSDNWQKGMGFSVMIKSLWRHFKDVWTLHRGYKVIREEKGRTIVVDMEDALCGVMFNSMGYLHEILVAKGNTQDQFCTGYREAFEVHNQREYLKSITNERDPVCRGESSSDQKT